jgi:hypothetical protein
VSQQLSPEEARDKLLFMLLFVLLHGLAFVLLLVLKGTSSSCCN